MKIMKFIVLASVITVAEYCHATEVEIVGSTSVTSTASEQAGTPRNPFSESRNSVTTTGLSQTTSATILLDLNEGELLSQQIKYWADKNGFKVLWNSSSDYLIYKTIHLAEKDIDTLLMKLGELFTSENYGLVIKNFRKNSVLVIDEQ